MYGENLMFLAAVLFCFYITVYATVRWFLLRQHNILFKLNRVIYVNTQQNNKYIALLEELILKKSK